MEEYGERVNQVKIGISKINKVNHEYDAYKSVCKITCLNLVGTGFFIKLLKNNKDFYCLISCEHVIQSSMIESNETIKIDYDNYHKSLKIKLNEESFIRNYRYLNIDASIIEILPKDKIDKYYFLLPDLDYKMGYKQFNNKFIFIPQFPLGEKLSSSKGQIKAINEFSHEFTHLSSTESGSSGSPIFIKNKPFVLGIHKQGKNNRNIANFIGPIIDSLKNDFDYGIIQYNSNTYEGDFIDHIKDGNGKIVYNKYDMVYYGKWVDFKREGNGILYYDNEKNKIIYQGNFVNDLYEGNGKLYYKDGNYYIGEFKGGKRHGKGIIYTKENQIEYEGNFAFDHFQGYGLQIFKDKPELSYEGEFKEGKLHGKGKFMLKKKIIYEGLFDNHQLIENKGKLHFQDGSYYVGPFFNNKMHGKGKIFYSNNLLQYEGDFRDGKKEGDGKFYYEDKIRSI